MGASATGSAATVDGSQFPLNLAGSCGDYVEFNLLSQYIRFESTVGLGDDSPSGSAATFNLYVDERHVASETTNLFETKTLDVSGANRLRLETEVTDCDAIAVFAEPYLIAGS